MSTPEERYKSVLAILNRIAEVCERMEKNMMTLTEKMSLTQENYTPIIGYVQPKKERGTGKIMTEGIAELKFDFDTRHTLYIDLDNKRLALHHCKWAGCGKTFYSLTGNPEKCPHCTRRHWQEGKYLWDIKKGKKTQNEMGDGSPDNST